MADDHHSTEEHGPAHEGGLWLVLIGLALGWMILFFVTWWLAGTFH
jgi:hypothetical protein